MLPPQGLIAADPPGELTRAWMDATSEAYTYPGAGYARQGGVAGHGARRRLKPFVPAVPEAETACAIEVNPARLETAIAALAASVRDGSRFDTGLLTKGGVPAALAARLPQAARVAPT